MRDSVKVRLTSALERGEADTKLNNIAKLTARYVCRLIGSREFRKGVKLQLQNYPTAYAEVISLKDNLDYSTVKNKLLRSIHRLITKRRITRSFVISTARGFRVDYEDVAFLYQALTATDLRRIAKYTLSPREYEEDDVLRILKQIEYLLRSLVHRRLLFVLANDPMVESAEDLLSPLRINAVKVIREYEIQPITYEHMLNRVIRGVQNKATNLAEMYGRDKRQPVMKVTERDPYRLAWYLDISSNTICRMRTFPEPSLRRRVGKNVCIIVQQVEDDEWIAVHHKRLYATKLEAQEALQKRLRGERSKRDSYLDPSPQGVVDFKPSAVSMDSGDSETNFHEYLPAANRLEIGEDIKRMRQILHGLPRRSREFAELVFSSEVDTMFDAWCEAHGYNTGMCNNAQLGRLACKYLKISKAQLKVDLASSPASLWDAGQRARILRGISSVHR